MNINTALKAGNIEIRDDDSDIPAFPDPFPPRAYIEVTKSIDVID